MRKYRFTLADDDAHTLFLIHRRLALRFPESSIAAFSNAEDALHHILHSGADLLITDHGMGHMDGAQLIRELRSKGIEIPIIMVSGNPAAAEEAKEAGATEFVEKQGGMNLLDKHIMRLLQAEGTASR